MSGNFDRAIDIQFRSLDGISLARRHDSSIYENSECGRVRSWRWRYARRGWFLLA